MGNFAIIGNLALLLRVILSLAVLALIPMTEAAHAMPGTAAMQMTGVTMDMRASMNMSHDTAQASHHADGLSCRILCLGWVEHAAFASPHLPFTAVTRVEPLVAIGLPDGIAFPPQGRPPKQA